ncbi:amidohydrolase [Halobacillus halophilus]|uniref:Indole-3-acetyl-L-aspartic acid hydrolase n=1 Tax=Halobacillus halophilus (strain ATCC 35676 / DSM 2266 / JCM 20832 / KCTC 3685 / LMG 17431 / NBRC 102448 / NCIMB 2269) TaxID=866895 RepID=I0JIF3_HALH3|nr:amidohydrolase [Halobacillus halophilus]ASF38104.1 amidohydrolase [Halobacillus halophilus]CCG43921.1 indole-3-acetyl-L-aspartic acid hydrolase [Halobacillus halophilus DSM 2266]
MPHNDSFIQAIQPKLTEWRRHFHKYPELGFMEYCTTYTIGQELEKLGFTLYVGKDALQSDSRYGVPDEETLQEKEIVASASVDDRWLADMKGGHTGLVAVWDTEQAGDHLAFRFDIDALPITEAEDEQHFPSKHSFVSKHTGVMHACGHDGHTTIGLGLAHFIAENSSDLNGKFTLLFQPAEEGGRGARAMTDKGWLNGVDYFYSGHIGIQDLPVGTVAATTKGFLASAKLDAHFNGQSSHAGMKPEEGRNALLAAATAATQLHSIPRHSEGISRVNAGKLIAGNGRNIISDRGFLEIETRGETKAINAYMQKEARRMIQAAADMHQVDVEIDFVGETEQMICDDSLASYISKVCEPSAYIHEVIPVARVSGSEDASFMMNEVQSQGGQATYMLFGTHLPDNHHSPSFDFEEEVLTTALDTYIHIIKGGHLLD